MNEPFELRSNLRLDKDGNIYCEDGQNVADYIASDRIGKAIPSPIVILTREDFFRLCCDYDKRKREAILQDALTNGLILAA